MAGYQCGMRLGLQLTGYWLCDWLIYIQIGGYPVTEGAIQTAALCQGQGLFQYKEWYKDEFFMDGNSHYEDNKWGCVVKHVLLLC